MSPTSAAPWPAYAGMSATLSTSELLDLVEGWLRNAPELTFKRVRDDARNLGVSITPRQFAEAKKRLGITGAAPRPATPRPRHQKSIAMNGASATTPLMTFVVEFLRGNREATYQEVKAAGAAANFQVAPINYGNARRIVGIAPKSKAPRTGRRRRIRQEEAAQPSVGASTESPPAVRGRRGRKKLDFGNLSNLVAELQGVVSERDRLLAALDQIASIIKNV